MTSVTRVHFPAIFSLLVLILSIVGCSKKTPVIEAIPEAELPQAVRDAFVSAPIGLKTLADEAANAFEAKNFAQASMLFEKLVSSPDLNPEQSSLIGRAFLSSNTQLSQAAESGDAQAEQFQRMRMENK